MQGGRAGDRAAGSRVGNRAAGLEQPVEALLGAWACEGVLRLVVERRVAVPEVDAHLHEEEGG